jgi:hypothetical protein
VCFRLSIGDDVSILVITFQDCCEGIKRNNA